MNTPDDEQRDQPEQGVKPTAKSGVPPPPSGPRAYFLTLSCYGAWLHGNAAGSVDPQHNVHGTLVVRPNTAREKAEQNQMDQPLYELDPVRRGHVLDAIKEVCVYRGWWLFAAHVRSRHFHAVVQAGDAPEKVVNDFKAYASRRLHKTGLDAPDRKRWSRHGSTRYLWKQEDLERAIKYVLHEQGALMAVYHAPGVTYPELSSEPRP